MRYLLTVLFVFLIYGCAGNDRINVGDGKFFGANISLGDGKLFGSRNAYLVAVTGAQYAVFKNPTLSTGIKGRLANARDKVVDAAEKYDAETVSELVVAELRAGCGFWCSTVAGKEYLETYIGFSGALADELEGWEGTPLEYIDLLNEYIELVEDSTQ